MGDDHKELANRLFATATAMLEDMIEDAVAGQSAQLAPSQISDCGRRLQAAARDIAIVAEAAVIISQLNTNHASKHSA